MGGNCIFVPVVGAEGAKQSMGTGIELECILGNIEGVMKRNESRGLSNAAPVREGMISVLCRGGRWGSSVGTILWMALFELLQTRYEDVGLECMLLVV